MELRLVVALAVLVCLILQFSGVVKRDLVPVAALLTGAGLAAGLH